MKRRVITIENIACKRCQSTTKKYHAKGLCAPCYTHSMRVKAKKKALGDKS